MRFFGHFAGENMVVDLLLDFEKILFEVQFFFSPRQAAQTQAKPLLFTSKSYLPNLKIAVALIFDHGLKHPGIKLHR